MGSFICRCRCRPTGHTYGKMSLSPLEAMTTSDIRSTGSPGSGQRDRPQVNSCTRKSDGGSGRKRHYSEMEDRTESSRQDRSRSWVEHRRFTSKSYQQRQQFHRFLRQGLQYRGGNSNLNRGHGRTAPPPPPSGGRQPFTAVADTQARGFYILVMAHST